MFVVRVVVLVVVVVVPSYVVCCSVLLALRCQYEDPLFSFSCSCFASTFPRFLHQSRLRQSCTPRSVLCWEYYFRLLQPCYRVHLDLLLAPQLPRLHWRCPHTTGYYHLQRQPLRPFASCQSQRHRSPVFAFVFVVVPAIAAFASPVAVVAAGFAFAVLHVPVVDAGVVALIVEAVVEGVQWFLKRLWFVIVRPQLYHVVAAQ